MQPDKIKTGIFLDGRKLCIRRPDNSIYVFEHENNSEYPDRMFEIDRDDKEKILHFWKELLKVKDNQQFHLYGFGQGGPYKQLGNDLTYFDKHSDNWVKCWCAYLRLVGMEFVFKKGEETDFVKEMRQLFNKLEIYAL